MVQTRIVPTSNDIHILLPDDYLGKEVEIIAFTTDEGLSGITTKKRVVTFNATTLDTTGFKFDRDEANER